MIQTHLRPSYTVHRDGETFAVVLWPQVRDPQEGELSCIVRDLLACGYDLDHHDILLATPSGWHRVLARDGVASSPVDPSTGSRANSTFAAIGLTLPTNEAVEATP